MGRDVINFFKNKDITNNSVALVRERSIPTEHTLLVGKVSANVCGERV
jgi:hypothetical protein